MSLICVDDAGSLAPTGIADEMAGLYFCDNAVLDIAAGLRASAGELEISDLNRHCLELI